MTIDLIKGCYLKKETHARQMQTLLNSGRRFGLLIKRFTGEMLETTGRYTSLARTEEITRKYTIKNRFKRTLDLGCGCDIKNPFQAEEALGIDILDSENANIKQWDVALQGLPFDSESFCSCTAFDFIEHIPRYIMSKEGNIRYPFINVMNEIYRVLKNGGLFMSHTPCWPSIDSFTDPTHINIITTRTFPEYFCGESAKAKLYGYGFTGSFQLLDQKWVRGGWLVTVLQKTSN